MVLVKPASVIRWHYAGFRMFWGWRSGRKPWRKVGPEIRDLIHQMKRDNPTWGVRRIEGELRKIGINISYMTVYKNLPKFAAPPSPGWRAFLSNHMKETAAVDFLVVVTLSFQLLYAMVLISHGRRKIIHIDVTDHPTQDWVADQVTRAFAKNPKPKYLVRDRDAIFGQRFRARLRELNVKEKVTMRQSPWQNIFVERTIQSIRQECLDHVIVINRRHLRRLLTSYAQYYNFSRTHKSLAQDCPVHRPVQRPSMGKKIIAIPQVGGLHHRYERRAA
jgi:transposase InsO family protein